MSVGKEKQQKTRSKREYPDSLLTWRGLAEEITALQRKGPLEEKRYQERARESQDYSQSLTRGKGVLQNKIGRQAGGGGGAR